MVLTHSCAKFAGQERHFHQARSDLFFQHLRPEHGQTCFFPKQLPGLPPPKKRNGRRKVKEQHS